MCTLHWNWSGGLFRWMQCATSPLDSTGSFTLLLLHVTSCCSILQRQRVFFSTWKTFLLLLLLTDLFNSENEIRSDPSNVLSPTNPSIRASAFGVARDVFPLTSSPFRALEVSEAAAGFSRVIVDENLSTPKSPWRMERNSCSTRRSEMYLYFILLIAIIFAWCLSYASQGNQTPTENKRKWVLPHLLFREWYFRFYPLGYLWAHGGVFVLYNLETSVYILYMYIYLFTLLYYVTVLILRILLWMGSLHTLKFWA